MRKIRSCLAAAALLSLAVRGSALELAGAYAQASAAAARSLALNPWTEMTPAEFATYRASVPRPALDASLPSALGAYRAYRLDTRRMRLLLAAVPPEGQPSDARIMLPLPDGGLSEFIVSRAKEIATFRGVRVGDRPDAVLFEFLAGKFDGLVFSTPRVTIMAYSSFPGRDPEVYVAARWR